MDISVRIGAAAENECGLVKGQLLVVGVSGGADSLCLLDTLHRLGYNLLVAHFDHRLRPSSAEDARSAADAAQVRSLAYATGSMEVADYALKHHLSIEEAARKLRYEFLFHTARIYKAQAVAVGHTADDQVETVLMHLLRGSGLAGLKGMTYRSIVNEWDQFIPVARPLLDVWREETHAYCVGRGLEPVDDASNQDTKYLRNRLRHVLIPMLESYNPQVRQAIFRMSKTLASDWAVVEGAVEAAWQDCLVEEGEGYVALRTEALLEKQPGLQRNLVRRAAGRIDPGLRDFGLETVARTLAFTQSPPRSRQLVLTGKIQARLVGERFYLLLAGTQLPGEAWPQIPVGYSARLPIPGEVLLPGGWLLQVRMELPSELSSNILEALRTQADQGLLPSQHRYETWLDTTSLVLPLELRRHRAGERWQPLGTQKGSIKLSDFFTNVKLPRTARAGWPVLFSGDNIAWLPGFRPGQAYRVQADTTRMAHILLVKGD